jgi:hypothetical protein
MIPQERVAIDATRKTPFVLLQSGKIFIRGRAISENPGDFFRPILEWVRNYITGNYPQTEIELGFEYINTSSIKWIYAILKEIAGSKESFSGIRVTWNYEHGDDDMFELGLIMRSVIGCQFAINGVEKIMVQQQ